MAIRVQFDRNGWYSPVFGMLGRGDNAGAIYTLPDVYGEVEDFEYEHRDPATGTVTTRTKRRLKYLPSSTTFLDAQEVEQMKEEAEDQGGDPVLEVARPKRAEGESIPKAEGEAADEPVTEQASAPRPRRRRAA